MCRLEERYVLRANVAGQIASGDGDVVSPVATVLVQRYVVVETVVGIGRTGRRGNRAHAEAAELLGHRGHERPQRVPDRGDEQDGRLSHARGPQRGRPGPAVVQITRLALQLLGASAHKLSVGIDVGHDASGGERMAIGGEAGLEREQRIVRRAADPAAEMQSAQASLATPQR